MNGFLSLQEPLPEWAGGFFLGVDVLSALARHQRHDKKNQVSNGHTTTIPDGYCNVYELSEEVSHLLGAELNLHAPTGCLQLSAKKRLVFNSGLPKLLWFSRERFEPGKTYIADEPHRPQTS